jgi:ATP-dependent helicase HrpB
VLCFLPGVAEIRNTQRALQELLPAPQRQSVRVLPLHGNLSAQQQDAAIRWVRAAPQSATWVLASWPGQPLRAPAQCPAESTATDPPCPARADPQGSRRVILATPIAESSLTIEGVRLVVDAGFRRTPSYDLATGISR